MTPKHFDFIPQTSNGFVFLLERFGLKDWLPLGLGQVVLTLIRNLMHGTRGAWLNAITLPFVSISRLPMGPDVETATLTLTFRCRHGLHDN
jgi:hypothetical protein